MSRVVFISQPRDAISASDTQTGSVAIVLWELARRMAAIHQVLVLAPQARAQAREETGPAGIRIRRIPFAFRALHKALDLMTCVAGLPVAYFASPAYFREYALGAAHILTRESPDIVHLENCPQFLPLLRAAAPQARLFLHVHDELQGLLPESAVSPYVRHADAIVTCSNFVTESLRLKLPYLAEHIHTVGNGVDLSRFRPTDRTRRADRAMRILYVGRVSPEKGVHVLTDAFDELVQVHPDVQLDIVGASGLLPFSQLRLLAHDRLVAALKTYYGHSLFERVNKQLLRAHSGYRRAIEQRMSTPARDRTHFRDYVAHEHLQDVYDQADLLVVPSICNEPFGLPLVEAMATGLPCVVTRAGAMPEIAQDSVTGIVVDRSDPRMLARALQRLLLSPDERLGMGAAGRDRAERLFDWKDAADRLGALYWRYTAPAGR